MFLRRDGLDVSSLEKSISDYLTFNASLLKHRRHYILLKVLNFLRDDLGLRSIDDLLKVDGRSLVISMQKWINKRVGETSIKTLRYELYLTRGFFSFYDIELPSKKLKVPRKAAKSRVDRIPSIAELQKLISFSRSPRLRLILMILALTGLRLDECLQLRREYVDLERGFLIVPPEHDKNGKGREVPIPTELKNELKLYFERHFPHERGYIIPSDNNPAKRMPKQRFYDLYHRLLKRTGLDMKTPDGSAYMLHAHTYRKFYRTTLEAAGVNKMLVDLWLGQNSGVEKRYYLPTAEIIRKEFEKADQALKIFGRHDDMKTLEEKVEALIRYVETLKMALYAETGSIPSGVGFVEKGGLRYFHDEELGVRGGVFVKTRRQPSRQGPGS
jgi:integrase